MSVLVLVLGVDFIKYILKIITDVIKLLSKTYVMIHIFSMLCKRKQFIQIPSRNKCYLFSVCQYDGYKIISHIYFNLHCFVYTNSWTFSYMALCSFLILFWDLSCHISFAYFLRNEFEVFFMICNIYMITIIYCHLHHIF